MRILYAIQGTGNGHVSRAREVIPHLQKHGSVDVLLSGTQNEVGLEQEIKYRMSGMGFVFGKSGGIDICATWRGMHTRQLISDIKILPVESYDLVISDYEPISAWACKFRKKKCVALSHQCAYESTLTPQLNGFHWGKMILEHYAPTKEAVGFHFQAYDHFIHTPIIRKEIRDLSPEKLGHYTVYLPAYSDALIEKLLSFHTSVKWEVFSKHAENEYTKDHIHIVPISNQKFQKSLSQCEGFLTGGGFEGPAESLFLGKKLLSVPMKNQYEQQCNSLALEKMGIEIVWKESEFEKKLARWIKSDNRIEVDYPDQTAEIVADLIRKHAV